MWIFKNYEMINLNNIDNIDITVYESDSQFELIFFKNNEVINIFYYDSEEELKRNYENIINGIRNNFKVLNI